MDRRQFFGACAAGVGAVALPAIPSKGSPFVPIYSVTYLGPEGRTITTINVKCGKWMRVDDADAGCGYTAITLLRKAGQ